LGTTGLVLYMGTYCVLFMETVMIIDACSLTHVTFTKRGIRVGVELNRYHYEQEDMPKLRVVDEAAYLELYQRLVVQNPMTSIIPSLGLNDQEPYHDREICAGCEICEDEEL